MSLFAKKKTVFEPPVGLTISLLLFGVAFVYALCFGNPYAGNSSDLNLANLEASCWVPGAAGLCVIFDFYQFYEKEMKSLVRFVLSMSVGCLQLAAVITAIVFYWLNYGDAAMALQAPRVGSACLLLLLAFFSVLYRYFTQNGKAFLGDGILSNKSSLLMSGAIASFSLSLFPLAEYATYNPSASGFDHITAYILCGASAVMIFAALFYMKKPLSQEQNLCKNAFFGSILLVIISIVSLSLSISAWSENIIAYQVFYWSIFSDAMIIIVFGCSAFYFGYVSNSFAE